MSSIKRLVDNYAEFISIPWRYDGDAEERIIFCVYDSSDELRIRYRVEEFELATVQANHRWISYDLTDAYPKWFVTQTYAEKYFRMPDRIGTLHTRFLDSLEQQFISFLEKSNCDADTVIALTGVGTLYGFVRVKEVVDRFAPHVLGKLLVFFPGRYEQNNYRLLDGYDGWSYRAVPLLDDTHF